MRPRIIVYFLALTILFALFSAPVLGDALSQSNPTAQQQTIDAAIGQLFTQTAEAQMQAGTTLTVEAAFQQAQTATAGFPLTVQAGFDRALTATAEAAQSPTATATPIVRSLNRVTLTPGLETYDQDDLVEAAAVIEARLMALGIPEVTVEIQADDSLLVTYPDGEYEQDVLTTMVQPGLLEFVDMSGLSDQVAELVGQKIWTSEQAVTYERWDIGTPVPTGEPTPQSQPETGEPFQTVITGAGIERAFAGVSPQPGEWVVTFELTPEGGAILGEFTETHIGESMAIVLDGVVLSAPLIQARLDSEGVVSGGFTQEQAEQLALQLNSGALPIPLVVAQSEFVEVTGTPAAVIPTIPSGGTPTPLPTNFPTATTAEINVAEQVFEGGRMLWIQPTDQIWVLVVTSEGEGTWTVYDDTFEEGDVERDPTITPPQGLYQPERGFGKLWRETPEVREALGWAVTPEFGYVSPYAYHPGGEVVDGEYVPGPGYHVLYSLYGEQFRFNESDGTWMLG